MDKPRSVFLSHNSRDKPFVRWLAANLCDAGITVWVDEAELRIGDSLIARISEAIYKTDFVVAVISENSVMSDWVQKELYLAMTREIEGRSLIVLPLLIEHVDLPYFLRDKVYADFTDPASYTQCLERLIRTVRSSFPHGSTSSYPEAAIETIDPGKVVHDRGNSYLGYRTAKILQQVGIVALIIAITLILITQFARKPDLILIFVSLFLILCGGGFFIGGILFRYPLTKIKTSY